MKNKLLDFIKKYYCLFAIVFTFYQVKLLHTFIWKLDLIRLTSFQGLVLGCVIAFNSWYFINYGIKDFKKVFDNKLTFVLFVLLSLIITFFIGGHQLFFSGELFSISLGILKMFFCLWILVVPLVFNIILFVDKLSINDKSKKKLDAKYYRRFFISVFLISFIINLLASIGFFPGNMTSDSVDVIAQAMGILPIGGGHPPFYTLLLRLLFLVFRHPFSAIVANNFFMSLLLAYIFTYLRKDKVKSIYLYVMLILFTLSCNSLVLMTILWKDIPFTIALLWLTFEVYRVVKEKDKYFASKLNIARMVIALVFVYLLRYNGMFPYIVIIGYLIYVAIKSVKKKPVLFTIGLSVISLIIIKGPIFGLCGVERISLVSGGSSFAQKGVIALVYYDGNLSDTDRKTIESIAPKDILMNVYSKYNIDTISFGEYSEEISENMSNLGSVELYKLYVKYFFIDPQIIVTDRLDSNNLLWSYVTPDDGFNSTYAVGIWYPDDYDYTAVKLPAPNDLDSNAYVPKINSLNNIVLKYLDTTQNTPLYYLFWRPAIALSFFLILCYYVIKNKIKVLPVMFPTIINILFWVMLLSHQSFRYLWFIQVNTYILYLIVLNNKKNS
ncbi:MAG: hypothetical protein K6C11_02685 [Bacilli bacterium]|nr:hypothetical protein [Bacilli bacterium]